MMTRGLKWCDPKKYNIVVWSMLMLISLLFSGCAHKTSDNRKRICSTTILPVQYFMNQLGGDAIEVGVLIPKGANPATYSPTPGQIKMVSGAQLYVQTGHLGFEMAWMDRLKELNPEMRVVNLSDSLLLIKGEHQNHHTHNEGVDPHVWMSPRQVLHFLPVIREAMVSTWPQLADSINARYNIISHEVKLRDEALLKVVEALSNPKFIIFHPALTYLARDYGFEQLSIEFEGKEPSPVALRKLIDKAREENVAVIFIQKEFDRRNADLISKETGLPLEVINPLSYDWIHSMDKIIALLEKHLR